MSLRPPPGLHRRPVLEPQCTHLNMTRLYDPEALCCMCHRPGRFGWVYQCTQDQENLIEHAVSQTGLEVFDHLGQDLCAQLTLRERSPAAREDRLSFFTEITPQQMSQYRPDQIATILKQRENVQTTIQKDRMRENSAGILGLIDQNGSQGQSQYHLNKPWVARVHEICQYMVCPNCRPAAADRAYMSLDAVAKGEIPPTAAAGYGFHVRGERPVVNADILKTIGSRYTPLSRRRFSEEDTSFESDLSVMELLEHQIARERNRWTLFPGHYDDEDDDKGATINWPLASTAGNKTTGHLKHSPKCDNLAAYSDTHEPAQHAHDQPPWTPPPSPGYRRGQSTSEVDASAEMISDGSPIPMANMAYQDQPITYAPAWQNTPFNPPLNPPEPGRVPLDEVAYDAACMTPLDPPDLAEERYLNGSLCPTSAMGPDGKFTPAPLKVDHGVAMLEESVALEIPDVITQA